MLILSHHPASGFYIYKERCLCDDVSFPVLSLVMAVWEKCFKSHPLAWDILQVQDSSDDINKK